LHREGEDLSGRGLVQDEIERWAVLLNPLPVALELEAGQPGAVGIDARVVEIGLDLDEVLVRQRGRKGGDLGLGFPWGNGEIAGGPLWIVRRQLARLRRLRVIGLPGTQDERVVDQPDEQRQRDCENDAALFHPLLRGGNRVPATRTPGVTPCDAAAGEQPTAGQSVTLESFLGVV
jgi:hypothetical protein